MFALGMTPALWASCGCCSVEELRNLALTEFLSQLPIRSLQSLWEDQDEYNSFFPWKRILLTTDISKTKLNLAVLPRKCVLPFCPEADVPTLNIRLGFSSYLCLSKCQGNHDFVREPIFLRLTQCSFFLFLRLQNALP